MYGCCVVFAQSSWGDEVNGMRLARKFGCALWHLAIHTDGIECTILGYLVSCELSVGSRYSMVLSKMGN